jgi:hypothetical protein
MPARRVIAKNGVFILSIYLGVNCILNVSILGLTHNLLRSTLHDVLLSELTTRRPALVLAKLSFS